MTLKKPPGDASDGECCGAKTNESFCFSLGGAFPGAALAAHQRSRRGRSLRGRWAATVDAARSPRRFHSSSKALSTPPTPPAARRARARRPATAGLAAAAAPASNSSHTAYPFCPAYLLLSPFYPSANTLRAQARWAVTLHPLISVQKRERISRRARSTGWGAEGVLVFVSNTDCNGNTGLWERLQDSLRPTKSRSLAVPPADESPHLTTLSVSAPIRFARSLNH